MKAKTISLFIAFLVSIIACYSNEVSGTYVYIYKRPNSAAYHYNPHCRGLQQNSTDVEKLTVKETVEKGRKLCRYED
ncbi:hypothetical protein [Capnocytophaga gingivalis]|jgi:hypothetical protein|uniref:Lipoprotein n=1 Tax=Capnocytophaga gingivalis TaxID=1017 RepID=A0A250FSF2_9FLAO|nr:hypothetical protein [Capnocytophaga gingivalis]ATA88060.1 hypothetical protein CGC50_13485 [Capnocytophaga gingivalis]